MRKARKNPKSYHTREEVEATGKPFCTGRRWIGTIPDFSIFLSKSRCAELGYPIQEGEPPAGYRYNTNGPGPRKYIPVYDRTGILIDLDLLFENEIIESQGGSASHDGEKSNEEAKDRD